eukprot:1596285-Prymnesium_polylepis.1
MRGPAHRCVRAASRRVAVSCCVGIRRRKVSRAAARAAARRDVVIVHGVVAGECRQPAARRVDVRCCVALAHPRSFRLGPHGLRAHPRAGNRRARRLHAQAVGTAHDGRVGARALGEALLLRIERRVRARASKAPPIQHAVLVVGVVAVPGARRLRVALRLALVLAVQPERVLVVDLVVCPAVATAAAATQSCVGARHENVGDEAIPCLAVLKVACGVALPDTCCRILDLRVKSCCQLRWCAASGGCDEVEAKVHVR